MSIDNNENLHAADQVYFLYDPQPVRLLDVVYVGPVMIYGGIMGKNLPAFVRWSLVGVGICTILYNGANFYINEKKAREKREEEGKNVKVHKNAEILDEVLLNIINKLERLNQDNGTVPENIPIEQHEEVLVPKSGDEIAANAQVVETQTEEIALPVESADREESIVPIHAETSSGKKRNASGGA